MKIVELSNNLSGLLQESLGCVNDLFSEVEQLLKKNSDLEKDKEYFSRQLEKATTPIVDRKFVERTIETIYSLERLIDKFSKHEKICEPLRNLVELILQDLRIEGITVIIPRVDSRVDEATCEVVGQIYIGDRNLDGTVGGIASYGAEFHDSKYGDVPIKAKIFINNFGVRKGGY